MRSTWAGAVAVCLGLSALGAAASARAEGAQASRVKAAIVLNLLKYDRKLPSRVSGNIVIAVITDAASASRRTGALAAFAKLAKRRVRGKRIRVLSLHLLGRDKSRLATLAGATGANLFWVVDKCTRDTQDRLLRYAKRKRIPVAGGSSTVARAGAAFAVGIVKGRPRVFVNLRAARSVGVDLPAAVLRLATVIR